MFKGPTVSWPVCDITKQRWLFSPLFLSKSFSGVIFMKIVVLFRLRSSSGSNGLQGSSSLPGVFSCEVCYILASYPTFFPNHAYCPYSNKRKSRVYNDRIYFRNIFRNIISLISAAATNVLCFWNVCVCMMPMGETIMLSTEIITTNANKNHFNHCLYSFNIPGLKLSGLQVTWERVCLYNG